MRHYLSIRGHLYVELSAKEVYRLMKLGTNLASDWCKTPLGLDVAQVLTDHFQNYFHERVYLTTEQAEIQEVGDGIELSVRLNLEVEVGPEWLEENLAEQVQTLFLEAYDHYNQLFNDSVSTQFYEVRRFNIL